MMKMKIPFACMASVLLLLACAKDDGDSTDSSFQNSANGASAINGTSSAADASALDISFYTEALTEDETLPTDASTEAYNDYIENDADYAAGWANTFYINYTDDDAVVTGLSDGDADFTVTKSGAHVVITAQKKAHYILSGSSSNGSLTIDGAEKKAWVTLNGLVLTSTQGAAISKTSDKRLYIEVAPNTANALTDGTVADHKATLFSQGKLTLSGTGVLTVTANYKNCIHSSDYIRIRKNTYTTLYANANNGIKANDSIIVDGGVLNISVTATAGKGLSSDGYIFIKGGRTTVLTSGGGTWDTTDSSTSACSGIKADIDYLQTGGGVYLKSTGAGGKGISSDGATTIADGTVRIVTTGSKYTYGNSSSSNYSSAPKGIKADGNFLISGGDIAVVSSRHEGIESKGTITISGGYVYVSASDDAINSSSHFTISGGCVMGSSSGNDGMDANGNFYISGGNVFAVAASQPEVGIDANTESGYKLNITGGNIVSIGGFESGASISAGTAMQASYSRGAWYALYNGSSLAFAYMVPSFDSMGSSMAVYTASTPALYSGVSTTGSAFWIGYGNTAASGGSSVSLSSYTGGSGMGGGGTPSGPSGPGGWR